MERALELPEYADVVSLRAPYVSPPAAAAASRKELAAEILGDLGGDASSDDPRRDLTALLTTRPPGAFPGESLLKLDRLLAGESAELAVTGLGSLAAGESADLAVTGAGTPPPAGSRAEIVLWRGDITTLSVDAIVNAANSALLGCRTPFHRCIDNAIHSVAGPRLREDCAAIIAAQGNPEPTGVAKATRGYHLPARYVLHTVGPIVSGPLTRVHQDQLASCYRSCLDVAAAVGGVRSVAFCGISTGAFGFPVQPAADIAVATVASWLEGHPGVLDRVVFDVFSAEDLDIYRARLRRDR